MLSNLRLINLNTILRVLPLSLLYIYLSSLNSTMLTLNLNPYLRLNSTYLPFCKVVPTGLYNVTYIRSSNLLGSYRKRALPEVSLNLKKSPICFKRKRKEMVLSFVVERPKAPTLRYFTCLSAEGGASVLLKKSPIVPLHSFNFNETALNFLNFSNRFKLPVSDSLNPLYLEKLSIPNSISSDSYVRKFSYFASSLWANCKILRSLNKRIAYLQTKPLSVFKYRLFNSLRRSKHLRTLICIKYARSRIFREDVGGTPTPLYYRCNPRLALSKFNKVDHFLWKQRLIKFYSHHSSAKPLVKLCTFLYTLVKRPRLVGSMLPAGYPVKRFIRIATEHTKLRMLVENRRGDPIFIVDLYNKLSKPYKEYRSMLREFTKLYNGLGVYNGFFRVKNFFGRKQLRHSYIPNNFPKKKLSDILSKSPWKKRKGTLHTFVIEPRRFRKSPFKRPKFFKGSWLARNFRTHRPSRYKFIKDRRLSTKFGLNSLFLANPVLFILRSFTIVMPRGANSRKFTRVLTGVLNSLLLLNRAIRLEGGDALRERDFITPSPLYKRPAFWWGTVPYKKRRRKKRTRRRRKQKNNPLYKVLPPTF